MSLSRTTLVQRSVSNLIFFEVGLRRAAGRDVAEIGKLLRYLGVLDDLQAERAQTIDHRSRRAGGRDEAEEDRAHHVGHAELAHRRHIRASR